MNTIYLKTSTLIFLIILVLFACRKDDTINTQTENSKETIKDTEYNNDLKLLAIAISNAWKNNESFGEFVKTEAEKQFDGDYDILLKTALDKQISAGNSKAKSTLISVRELLTESYPDNNKSLNKNNINVINELTEKYPQLQISVPVNINQLNTKNTPTVVYIPEEFTEFISKQVPGINSEGNMVMIDANNEPSVPYIVIGLNERVDEKGNLIYSVQNELCRNEKNIQNNYISQYNDSDLLNEPEPINANKHQLMKKFSTTIETNKTVCISWSFLPQQNIKSVKLYKLSVNTNNNWILISQNLLNAYDYFDNNITAGETIKYKLVAESENPTVVTDTKYDIVKVPYRNPSEENKIYCKGISWSSLKDIESWVYGKPEFYFKFYTVDNSTGKIVNPNPDMIINSQITSRNNNKTYKVNNLFYTIVNYADFWHSRYTIDGIEYDPVKKKFNKYLDIEINYKDTIGIAEMVSKKLTKIKVQYKNGDKSIGTVYYNFFDPINQTLQFGKGGVKLYLGDQK